jgi:excisionase family DNA binding protein
MTSPSTEKSMGEQHRRAVSQAELAIMIGVSVSTAGRMIKAGVVRSVKIRNRRLIPITEIEKLLTPAA